MCVRVSVCLCVRVPSYLCVEIMNHLGASRHRKTKRKLSDRETTVQRAQRGSVFCSICVQKSIGNTNNINCLWKKRKINTVCTGITFRSYPAVYMYIHTSYCSVALALSKIEYKICNLCLLRPSRVANASWLPLSVDTLWPGWLCSMIEAWVYFSLWIWGTICDNLSLCLFIKSYSCSPLLYYPRM